MPFQIKNRKIIGYLCRCHYLLFMNKYFLIWLVYDEKGKKIVERKTLLRRGGS